MCNKLHKCRLLKYTGSKYHNSHLHLFCHSLQLWFIIRAYICKYIHTYTANQSSCIRSYILNYIPQMCSCNVATVSFQWSCMWRQGRRNIWWRSCDHLTILIDSSILGRLYKIWVWGICLIYMLKHEGWGYMYQANHKCTCYKCYVTLP